MIDAACLIDKLANDEDALAELCAALDDPGAGDPETWLSEWDRWRWELGPEPAVEFGEAPTAEAEPYQPTAADWLDYALWSERLELERQWSDDALRAGCHLARFV